MFDKIKYRQLVIALIIVTGVTFFPVLENDFTNWDDLDYVVENQSIRNINIKSIQDHFSTYVMGNYHPITMLSYAIDYQIGGLNSQFYVGTNLFLHIVNGILVMLFFQLLFQNRLLAFFAALVFLLHPMHVESVAWISGRKDLIATVFSLLTMISYHRFISGDKKVYLFVSIVLFVLALLSKATAVVLMPILLILDVYYQRKVSLTLVVEKLPFVLGAIIFGMLAIQAQQSAEAIIELDQYTFVERICIASYNTIWYIIRFIYPLNLSAFYPYPDQISAWYYIAPIFVVSMIGWGVRKLKSYSMIVLGVFMFLISISLLTQIIPVGSAVRADRYTYFSYIGLLIAVLAWVKPKLKQSLQLSLFVPVLLLAIGSHARVKIWKNSETLWTDVIAKQPHAEVAYLNRGKVYEDAGELKKAMKDWTRLIEINPIHKKANYNKGNVLLRTYQFEEAIHHYSQSIQADSFFDKAYNNRGKAYSLLKEYDEALKNYNRAIQINNQYTKAYYNRGYDYYVQEKYELAMQDLLKASILEPDANTYLVKGNINYAINRTKDAIHDYTRALSYETNEHALMNRGNVYLEMGDTIKGVHDFRQAKNILEQKGNKKTALAIEALLKDLKNK